MQLAELMLAEFERSIPTTKRHLERVPEDRLTWRPAPKSLTVGQLAFHIATAPGGVARLSLQDSAELPDFREFPQPSTTAEILNAFHRSVEEARSVLGGITEAQMNGTISFTRSGQHVITFQRADFLRDILFNHLYHHRGQLSVYLRELGVPVPSTFGPSADEERAPNPDETTTLAGA